MLSPVTAQRSYGEPRAQTNARVRKLAAQKCYRCQRCCCSLICCDCMGQWNRKGIKQELQVIRLSWEGQTSNLLQLKTENHWYIHTYFFLLRWHSFPATGDTVKTLQNVPLTSFHSSKLCPTFFTHTNIDPDLWEFYFVEQRKLYLSIDPNSVQTDWLH